MTQAEISIFLHDSNKYLEAGDGIWRMISLIASFAFSHFLASWNSTSQLLCAAHAIAACTHPLLCLEKSPKQKRTKSRCILPPFGDTAYLRIKLTEESRAMCSRGTEPCPDTLLPWLQGWARDSGGDNQHRLFPWPQWLVQGWIHDLSQWNETQSSESVWNYRRGKVFFPLESLTWQEISLELLEAILSPQAWLRMKPIERKVGQKEWEQILRTPTEHLDPARPEAFLPVLIHCMN